MTGYKPLDVLTLKVIEPVDCGTCPVTMDCAVEQGGNGYTYRCCDATGFQTVDEDGQPILLMIDCTHHKFYRSEHTTQLPACPLCSGNAIAIAMLGVGTPARWVPTVHARFSIKDRLNAFKKATPAAKTLVDKIEQRRRAT